MNDEQDTGMPTRAIHESYLSLQKAHREFRRARDTDGDVTAAQGVFQDAILTFYELVRPHLKHESSLSNYWRGELPDYTGWDKPDGEPAATYVKEQGTGVYQVQEHVDSVELNQQVLTDGGVSGFADWHELIGLSWDSERLVAVQPDADSQQYFIKVLRCAVLPLRELDHWQTQVVEERQTGGGFMASETNTKRRREYESPMKLVTGKRLLVEAADQLGALSEFDASTQRTEITREDMEKVEEWRQQQLDN